MEACSCSSPGASAHPESAQTALNTLAGAPGNAKLLNALILFVFFKLTWHGNQNFRVVGALGAGSLRSD